MQSCCKLNSFKRHLSEWLACCILLVSFASSLADPTYPWKDRQTNERLVCSQCPPGTCVAQHCTKTTPTVCKACPSLHYTQYWNYLDRCLYCNVFCNSMEEEAQPCNSTHNRVCQCKPGYHAESDFCIKHSECPPGSGLAQPGNPHEDTKCMLCPQGTFSSSSSRTDLCKPHQNCSEQGSEVNVPGNQLHDTICTTCKLDEAGSEEGSSGTEHCQEAVIDFVPYQIKSLRRLQRLKRILSNSSLHQGGGKKNLEELQVELHTYLLQLQDTEGKDSVLQKLHKAHLRMNLQHLAEKIKKRFAVVL
ncbi:tumor necrosis factor receptor superfamily member 6B [Elgaria multicarinata webbii]|uniref:tumor necrosis factor receptor superfamily member 6B n=1 Tax=Elgaria multicarinata webbii TaxID=159646 RepID=UPI002FCD254D